MTIRPNDFFPVVTTENLTDCRDFYTELFGFEIAFEADWYIHLVSDNGIQLGFLIPNHPSQPDFLQDAHSGAGLVYSFEVDDAEWEFEKLEELGVEILLPVTVEDWGQKHFMFRDPAGVLVDIVESIEEEEDEEE